MNQSDSDDANALGRLKISARALARAEELGLDLRLLFGRDRPIVAEETARPLAVDTTSARRELAAAMQRSKREIPHYYLWHTIDLEPALQWLAAVDTGHGTDRILPIALLVRAVALALRELPELIGRPHGIHVGLAVSLREGGLVNPALHDADHGSVGELMTRIRDVTRRARLGALRSAELTAARITVGSLGEHGTDGVLGVIPPGHTAVVGFGAIAERPWVVDHELAVRRIVEVSLAADHRVSEPQHGARFLRAIQQRLADPSAL